jgi:hypothetical protein
MFDRLRDWASAHPQRIVAWGWVITLVLMAVAGVFVTRAYAATATVTWQNATQYTDNTPIPVGGIKETRIEYAKCTVSNNTATWPATIDGFKTVPFPGTEVAIDGLVYGMWCFRAAHVTPDGVFSEYAGPVWKQYLAPPKPPTLITVKSLVWDYRLKNGTEELRVVGTIEAGKPCSGLAPVTGFDLFTVNRADVRLERGVKKDATLIAQCEIT